MRLTVALHQERCGVLKWALQKAKPLFPVIFYFRWQWYLRIRNTYYNRPMTPPAPDCAIETRLQRGRVKHAFWIVLFCEMAWAQSSGQVTVTLPTARGEITAAADAISGSLNLKQGQLQGHVVIRDGTVTIGSPLVRFKFSGDAVDQVIAPQHIVVTAPTGIATADSGIYEVSSKRVTLRGHVVLTEGKNVIRGQALRYDLTSGAAVLQSAPGQRVQALLAPNRSR